MHGSGVLLIYECFIAAEKHAAIINGMWLVICSGCFHRCRGNEQYISRRTVRALNYK